MSHGCRKESLQKNILKEVMPRSYRITTNISTRRESGMVNLRKNRKAWLILLKLALARCVNHMILHLSYLLMLFCREEMVRNVQIATVLYEVLKTLLTPQTIEEKVRFYFIMLRSSDIFYIRMAGTCTENVIFMPDEKICCRCWE